MAEDKTLKAIKAFYAMFPGSGLAEELTSGFFDGEVPDGTVCPYGRFELRHSRHLDFTLDQAIFRVELYSMDGTEISLLLGLLLNLYDGQLLGEPLADENLGMDMTFLARIPPQPPDTHAWQGIVEFELGIDRA